MENCPTTRHQFLHSFDQLHRDTAFVPSPTYRQEDHAIQPPAVIVLTFPMVVVFMYASLVPKSEQRTMSESRSIAAWFLISTSISESPIFSSLLQWRPASLFASDAGRQPCSSGSKPTKPAYASPAFDCAALLRVAKLRPNHRRDRSM